VNVLVVDVGGAHVKILATGQKQSREFPSGPKMTPRKMVAGVKKLAKDWKYDTVSIGYPGVVLGNRPAADPYNLGQGWAGFDFEAAFKRPVKVINDAAMQALGSYKHGKMLFLAWVLVSAPPWSWMGSWNRWSSATCPIKRRRLKTTSGSED
jgi:polyphosphate glucokinase